MKKFLFSLIAISTALCPVLAAPVSPQSARNIAEKVLDGKRVGSPAKLKGIKVSEENEHPYYVFNAADNNGGYVIVAGDDRLPAVLGYSSEGYLDMDNAPEAMIALLQMSVDNVDRLNISTVNNVGSPVVAPLLGEINWGQDTPFNTMCPVLSGGTTAYVGCVATAMAQMMRYYSYPSKGIGSHSYIDNGKTLSADFGAAEYDWANMPASVPEKPTDAQVKAYSTLSSHLGVAVDMQYAAGGSGAYTHAVAPALRNYFGYSPELRMHTREYYNTDEWMQMISTELDARRPVYYSASSEDSAGGHAFVCDGYDSEGYVHINWGWYGRSNGYFYINHLNPGELGAGGGSGAYNISQEILTGFKPAEDSDVAQPLLFGATRMSCDIFGSTMTVMTFVENLDTDAFDGELSVVLTDLEDKEIKGVVYTQSYKLGGFSVGHPGSEMITLRNVTTTVDVPDGEYHIKLGYHAKGDNSLHIMRHPIGLPGYVKCKVEDKTIKDGVKHVPAPDVVMLTPLAPDGEIYAKGSVRFSVELKNNSSDFRLSSLVLTLKNMNKPEQTFSKTYPVNIYDLSSKTVIMDIDLPDHLEEGNYEVMLAHDKFADNPFSTVDGQPTLVKILPEASKPVLRFTSAPDPYNATTASDNYNRGDIIYANLAVKNYGAEGNCMIILRAAERGNPEHTAVLKGETKNWTKGENASVKMSNNIALDPGVYDCSFYYVASDGKEVDMNASPIEINIEESASPAIEVTEFELPAAMKQGERYPCKVTVRALRNVNGTFYIRARQFTYTNGEIVYMGSMRLNAGETKTLEQNYRPATSLADGKYLTMVEFKEGTVTAPASGHGVYYKEFMLGETGTGVNDIQATQNDAEIEWFTIDGIKVDNPSVPGLYIRRTSARSEKVLIK